MNLTENGALNYQKASSIAQTSALFDSFIPMGPENTTKFSLFSINNAPPIPARPVKKKSYDLPSIWGHIANHDPF